MRCTGTRVNELVDLALGGTRMNKMSGRSCVVQECSEADRQFLEDSFRVLNLPHRSVYNNHVILRVTL